VWRRRRTSRSHRRGPHHGPAGLGAFALAYTVWILATTLHRSMITDPMAIMGDIRGEERDRTSTGVRGGRHTRGNAACVIAPWVPSSSPPGSTRSGSDALRRPVDRWRLICRTTGGGRLHDGEAKEVLMNDLLFNTVQPWLSGRLRAGLHSVFAVVSAWGSGGGRGGLRSSAVLGSSVHQREEPFSGHAGRRAGGGQRARRQLGGNPALSDRGGCHTGFPAALGASKRRRVW